MKVLLVEDDETFLAGTVPEIERVVGTGNVAVARSRAAAEVLLKERFFDAFILDLRIPTSDGSLDDAVEHGQHLLHQIIELSPGSLVYFLTGSSADTVVTDLLDQAEKIDLWGERSIVSTVQLVRKSDLPTLLARIQKTKESVELLDEIELSHSGKPLTLSPELKRVVRVFARRWDGLVCKLRKVSSGLSGATVVIATVIGKDDKIQISAVGKLGTIADVGAETERFVQVKRLRTGAFPEQVDVVRSGTRGAAGVFYRLVDGPHATLFELLERDPKAAAAAVAIALNNLRPWNESAVGARRDVRDVRRCLLSDESAATISRRYALDWIEDFEAHPLLVKRGWIHGDLHCGNVLVRQDGSPIIIDFGDVKTGAIAIDPIVTELSLLFHPDARHLRATWPTLAHAANWCNVDEYIRDCAYADFIRACRGAAHEIAMDREVRASAYAFVLRQLKYDDTDKDLAIALLDAIRADLDGSFGSGMPLSQAE